MKKMNKDKAEQQAEEIIGMNFHVPVHFTSPMEAKLANELARQLQASNKVGKVFWAGAAAVVLINAIGIGMYFSGPKDVPVASVENTGSVSEVAGYYYTDKLNSY